MTLNGLHSVQYQTGREVGRGGEGTVYEVQNQSGLVLKLYNEPLDSEKTEKLRIMVAMRSPAVEAYAAWPTDLVTNDTGAVCGFVMKKLTGYVPLHMIFSPMDRKKLFPDKGYNFLAHVARNLATAFFKLHEAGLIVGDVNEGNILINSSGLVAFIDCDSFQVKGADKYFFCEVGIPRYTPPELLKERSFENILRTVNTDCFSLAVLIFQLLFLGRHPFAGKNRLAADFDEETAIVKHEFAYSLENKKKKLHPPPDSFPISNLPESLVSLFHRAFEQDERPIPAEWVKSLDSLLADMVTCDESKLHTYPAKLADCPWCYFKKDRGILYFLDDNYFQATAVLGDVESFVNGFHLDKMELKKWSGNLSVPGLTAMPIEKKFRNAKTTINLTGIAVILIGITVFYALHVSFIIVPAVFAAAFAIRKYSPWAAQIKEELDRRTMLYTQLKQNLGKLIVAYDNSSETIKYAQGLTSLNKLVQDFRQLPDEFERQKKLMEERIFNEQLDEYLAQFDVEGHTIPLFGAAKKSLLFKNGIRSAGDVTKLRAIKIPGIGPKNIEILLSWRRQLSSGFVYIPDQYKIATGMQLVSTDISKVKANLETRIRNEYQSLNYLKMNITNSSNLLARQINDLCLKTTQATVDLEAFRKFAA